MKLLRIMLMIAGLVTALHLSAAAANYVIDNPADRIKNPAEKIYNPASQIQNPAANIYNPASRMDDPSPISPPSQPLPAVSVAAPPSSAPDAAVQAGVPIRPKPAVPQKSYNIKSVKSYMAAIKKAFSKDDYLEFLSLTEDALSRIENGTLKASKKSRVKLEKFKVFGYGLLE